MTRTVMLITPRVVHRMITNLRTTRSTILGGRYRCVVVKDAVQVTLTVGSTSITRTIPFSYMVGKNASKMAKGIAKALDNLFRWKGGA